MMRCRDRSLEQGTTTLFIVGFAVVLMMLAAVVVNASAAYLQRQGLASLADGAALFAADAGAAGVGVYQGGVGDAGRLSLDQATAEAMVGDYLTRTGARQRYPGLRRQVRVSGDRVVVGLRARLDLPLTFPGTGESTVIAASGAAVVEVRAPSPSQP